MQQAGVGSLGSQWISDVHPCTEISQNGPDTSPPEPNVSAYGTLNPLMSEQGYLTIKWLHLTHMPVTYHIRAGLPDSFRTPTPLRRVPVPVQEPDKPGSHPVYEPYEIRLGEPFKENSVLVLQPTGIDLESSVDESPDALFKILDNRGQSIISLTVSPFVVFSSCGLEARITKPLEHVFSSETEHSLIVYKRKGRLRLLCDFTQFPELTLATTRLPSGLRLLYHLGTGSPFEQPITSNVYSDIPDFAHRCPLYVKRFPEIDKESLLRQVHDLAHAKRISDTLSRVRDSSELFEVCSPFPLDTLPTQ